VPLTIVTSQSNVIVYSVLVHVKVLQSINQVASASNKVQLGSPALSVCISITRLSVGNQTLLAIILISLSVISLVGVKSVASLVFHHKFHS